MLLREMPYAIQLDARLGTIFVPERTNPNQTKTMLSWTLTFVILALIAAVLGFGGLAGTFAGIAKILFFVFLVLLVVSAISRAVRGGRP